MFKLMDKIIHVITIFFFNQFQVVMLATIVLVEPSSRSSAPTDIIRNRRPRRHVTSAMPAIIVTTPVELFPVLEV